MAQAKTVRGTKLLVMIGDGEASEAFTHNCSVNGPRSIDFQAQTNDVNVPDCDDPDLMAWIEREKVSVGCSIQGSGVCNTPDVEFFVGYLADSDTRNIRFVIDVPGADGGGYCAGAFHCTAFQISGDRGSKAEISVTFQSSGLVSWVDGA